ncbi:MAG: 6,7-dimethyl-8-ribityllumazine synthase [Pseudomonadales bacterium]|nr:6,7-dimethyl-8-ribityllumazine synthase [Pseudomonadales bacterium]
MHRIAFIGSCWHKAIVDQFREAFTSRISELEQGEVDIEYIEAPGVVEVPLLARLCADRQQYDAIVVSGLVVDHGVYRHEFVAQSVLDAIMRVQLDTRIPIIYGILTPQDFLSEGREAFFLEHFIVKGHEAANACSKMLANLSRLAA